jgi:transcription elongation factor
MEMDISNGNGMEIKWNEMNEIKIWNGGMEWNGMETTSNNKQVTSTTISNGSMGAWGKGMEWNKSDPLMSWFF